MAVPAARFMMTAVPVRERGVALITALLVVALAVVAAAAMAMQLQVDIRRTANLLHGEQAYAYATAAESWAQVILRKDAAKNNVDSLDEDWASSLPPIAVQGGVVTGHVTDLQGRFNVNNLVTSKGTPSLPNIEYFKRMLTVLDLDPDLSSALLDWIDPDINATFPGGAEDAAYLLLNPPYRAANHRLVDISELRLVQGFTPEVVAALLPNVVALPEETSINVNTATPVVLQALAAGMTQQDVQTLLDERKQTAFTDIAGFRASNAMAGRPVAIPIGVNSQWFGVDIEVLVGSGRARLYCVLHRNGPLVSTIARIRRTDRLLPTG